MFSIRVVWWCVQACAVMRATGTFWLQAWWSFFLWLFLCNVNGVFKVLTSFLSRNIPCLSYPSHYLMLTILPQCLYINFVGTRYICPYSVFFLPLFIHTALHPQYLASWIIHQPAWATKCCHGYSARPWGQRLISCCRCWRHVGMRSYRERVREHLVMGYSLLFAIAGSLLWSCLSV